MMGDAVIAEAFTQERTLGRRLVHAELLALTSADEALGRGRRIAPVHLATNLEPCLMCVGPQ
jgi:tRNA(adenine34) deaminase